MTKITQFSRADRFQVLWNTGTRSIPTLMAKCSVSQATAYRYAETMRTIGFIERKPGSGGHNKVPEAIQKKVIQKLEKPNKRISTQQIADACHISDQTVRTIAREHGMAWRKLQRRGLTAQQRSFRARFCKAMLLRISDVPYIVWTDETSFWLNKASPIYAWVKIDNEDEYEPRADTTSEKVHVWGAVCANGAISLYLFEGNLTSPRYLNILKQRIREMRELNPEGFVFMCDNDPKHRALKVKKYIARNFMDSLVWPSYSPDINPLENIWSWLKRRVAKDMPKDIPSLKASIRRNWRDLTSEMILPYVDDMERRFCEVIKKQGRRIKT